MTIWESMLIAFIPFGIIISFFLYIAIVAYIDDTVKKYFFNNKRDKT